MKHSGVLTAIFLVLGVAMIMTGAFRLYEAFHDCPLPDDCGNLNGTTMITCTVMCPAIPNPEGLQVGAILLLLGLILLAFDTILFIHRPKKIGPEE